MQAPLSLLAALTLMFTGCCPPAPATPGPNAALRSYLRHIEEGESQQAFELLSARSRKLVGQESFEKYALKGGEGLRKLMSELQAPGLQVEWKAVLRDSSGREVYLIREGDTWRLDAGMGIPGPGFSPEAALGELLRAIEAQDCGALLACAPPGVLKKHTRQQLLSGCQNEMKALHKTSSLIRASTAKPIRISPDRVEMVFATNRKLVLVRSGQRWYIEDLW